MWGRDGCFNEGPVVWRPLTRSPCQQHRSTYTHPQTPACNSPEPSCPFSSPHILISPFGPCFVLGRVQTWREIRGQPGRWPWPLRGMLLDVGGVRPWLYPSVAGPVSNRLRGQSETGRLSVLSSCIWKARCWKAGAGQGQMGRSALLPFKCHRYPPSYWSALHGEHPVMDKYRHYSLQGWDNSGSKHRLIFEKTKNQNVN